MVLIKEQARNYNSLDLEDLGQGISHTTHPKSGMGEEEKKAIFPTLS